MAYLSDGEIVHKRPHIYCGLPDWRGVALKRQAYIIAVLIGGELLLRDQAYILAFLSDGEIALKRPYIHSGLSE
ncbi:hypothetical protein J27TS7_01950 [Paenibacillus dendritiformis]|nr:hypothetical protein J27TS7_01950 [Paenibacillus dendritiformis]